jgi:hypothetical protein
MIIYLPYTFVFPFFNSHKLEQFLYATCDCTLAIRMLGMLSHPIQITSGSSIIFLSSSSVTISVVLILQGKVPI